MKLFKTLTIAALLLFAVPIFAQNEILRKQGTAIVFGVNASLNPASDKTNFTDDIGTDTVDCEMALTALATNAAHQSVKCDLTSRWATDFAVYGVVDYTGETVTGNAGETVDYYWCPSPDPTTGQSNIGGNSGADAAVCDSCIPSGMTDAEFVKLCMFIGSLVVTDDADIQASFIAMFSSPTQQGQLVIMNSASDPFEASDIEMHTAFWPVITEVQ